MSNEEIIARLEGMKGNGYKEQEQAIDEAIKIISRKYLYDAETGKYVLLPCEDAVSREAVLNYIRDNYRRWFINDDAFMQCVNGIKDIVPVTPKPRWIPASERLPEKDGEYLLYGKVIEDEENNIFIGDYDSCAEAFGYWQEYYDPITWGYVGGELDECASVIAWMPLPEPYREGESE